MTEIVLNGTPTEIAELTILELVFEVTGRGISDLGALAVARNSVVIPRADWTSSVLADGDQVELVTALQGG